MAENGTENKKYDIVFVIDESGSMQEYINNVRDNIAAFVQGLRTDGVDVQLGLVEYGYGYLSVKKQELMDNVDAFVANLGAISVTNSGGENGLTAIMDEKNGAVSMNFREGANKEFIVVTDEGYMENDVVYSYYGGTAYSSNEVTGKLNAIGAKLDVFGAMKYASYNDYWNAQQDGEGWCQDEWTPIANATSGYLINGENVRGEFYDINSDFSALFKAAMIDGKVDDTTGTHQISFAHWGYGYTPPEEAAALSAGSASSVVIAPTA